MCTVLTFWNSGALSFSSRTITLIGTSTKLSCSESTPDELTLSLIVTRKDNVSLCCDLFLCLLKFDEKEKQKENENSYSHNIYYQEFTWWMLFVLNELYLNIKYI